MRREDKIYTLIERLAESEDDESVDIADELRAMNVAVCFTDNARAYVAFEDNNDVRVFIVDFENKIYYEEDDKERKIEILREFEGISEDRANELLEKLRK